MTAAERVFPLEPLLTMVRRGWAGDSQVRESQALSRTAGIDPSSVYHANRRQGGLLTVRQADEWAVRCGYHPIEVWGDQWLDVEAYEEGATG